MICQKCNFHNEENFKFCQNCGNNLEKEIIENPVCPECNKTLPIGTKFCHYCGYDMTVQYISDTSSRKIDIFSNKKKPYGKFVLALAIVLSVVALITFTNSSDNSEIDLVGTKWEAKSENIFIDKTTTLEFESGNKVKQTEYSLNQKYISLFDYVYDDNDDCWILLTSGESEYLSKSQIIASKSRYPTFTLSNDKLIMKTGGGGEIEYTKIY